MGKLRCHISISLDGFVAGQSAENPLAASGCTTGWFRSRHALGGAQVANQYLAAGLLNELELHVVPVLLGDGLASSTTSAAQVQLEQVRAVEARGVTHPKYRVVR
jgi:riboflavin biosynthesis pyrimidine reductase